MRTTRLELPRLYPEQAAIRRHPARFKVFCAGRRAGKTWLGSDMLITGSGALGGAVDGLPVAWFSPTYKMLAQIWRDVVAWAAPVTRNVSVSEKRVELVTGGTIDMWSLENPDAARGRKYAGVFIDEAAMVPGLEEAWQAVIRPTLTDYAGWAAFGSTPRGMNFFKTLYDLGRDPGEPDWYGVQLPTTVNPYIPADEVEAARRDMTARRFRQEYLAEFLEGEGYVFRNVTDCSTEAVQEPGESTYVAGVDFGRSNDYTAICVVDAATKREVYLDRFNGPDWTLQRTRILATLQRYNVTTALLEQNSFGSPNIEEIQKQFRSARAWTTTAQTKRDIVEYLVQLLENRECRLLSRTANEAAAVAESELLAYEQTELPSGMVRYSAPEGRHDDTVIARCLAYWCCRPQRERGIV